MREPRNVVPIMLRSANRKVNGSLTRLPYELNRTDFYEFTSYKQLSFMGRLGSDPYGIMLNFNFAKTFLGSLL